MMQEQLERYLWAFFAHHLSGLSMISRGGSRVESKNPAFSVALWTPSISCLLARVSSAKGGWTGAAGVCACLWDRIRCKKFGLKNSSASSILRMKFR